MYLYNLRVQPPAYLDYMVPAVATSYKCACYLLYKKKLDIYNLMQIFMHLNAEKV